MPALTYTNPKRRSEFAWLDTLRFMAALMVVAAHVRATTFQVYAALPTDQKTPWAQLFYMLTRIGNEAVILFFVISGFLVGGPALQRLAQRSFRLQDFAIDRLTRIMVPLVPALVWTAAVAYFVGQDPKASQIFGNMFGLQGVLVETISSNRPLWSLSYEIWFYALIFGLGWWLMARVRACLGGLSLILVALVFTELTPIYLFCWLIGVAAFLGRSDRRSQPILLLSVMTVVASIAIIEIQYGSVSVGSATMRILQVWTPHQDAGRILLSFGFALLIQQLILRPPVGIGLRRLHRLGTWGARFSFSLYLVHFPLLILLSFFGVLPSIQFDQKSVGTFFALVASCIFFGWIFYQFTERYTDGCRRWLRQYLQRDLSNDKRGLE